MFWVQNLEGTIASTETNNTSKKSCGIQLFAAGKFKGVALSGGHHAPLPPKEFFVEFYGRAVGFLDFLPSMNL